MTQMTGHVSFGSFQCQMTNDPGHLPKPIILCNFISGFAQFGYDNQKRNKKIILLECEFINKTCNFIDSYDYILSILI